jgi:hypothetical protein
MWIAGVSPIQVFHAIIAATVALFVFGIPAAIKQQRYSPILAHVHQHPRLDWMRIGIVGLVLGLTAFALKQDGYDWGMLAYAVGFGGSMIWFGSSAGVAISNLFPEVRSVGAWVKQGWLIAVAYVVGFVVLLMLLGWHPAPKLRPKHGPPGGGITQVNNR